MHVTDCRICCTNRLVKWSLSCNPHGIDEQGGLKTCLRWERHSPDTRVLDPRPQQKGFCASLLKQRSVLAGITVKGWNFKWDLKENSTKIVREWVGEGNVPTSPFIFPLLFFFSSNSKSPTLAKWSMSKEQTFKLRVVAHSIGTTPWKKKKKRLRHAGLSLWQPDSGRHYSRKLWHSGSDESKLENLACSHWTIQTGKILILNVFFIVQGL